MITPGFDELIHAPTRLSLVAFLAATGWADFKVLRESVGLSDSALSKQLATLEEAGYVEIRKAFVGKRPRTSARLTADGRTAFDGHVLALQQIVAGAGQSLVPASVRPRDPRALGGGSDRRSADAEPVSDRPPA